MKKNLLLTFSILGFANYMLAQNALGKLYKPSEVIITEDGIIMYEKWNSFLGDSVRNDEVGHPVDGWLEDLYENGQSLHNGFYAAGHLNSYKNLYEDGTVEREFTRMSNVKSKKRTFYKNGKLKSEVEYYNKLPVKQKDLYANGEVKYSHAYDKTMEYFLYKKSFFEDKKLQSILQLTDPNEVIYSSKEFYPTGDTKSEGTIKFNPTTKAYERNGTWSFFDEKGIAVNEEAIAAVTPVAPVTPIPATSTSSGTLPPEIKIADKNNDNAISPDEITASIDAFFDGDANYTPAKITNLIDFFFQQ